MLKQPSKPTVVISEPHIFGKTARYGGHQYAKVFARNGWNVILLSASFNLGRLFLSESRIDDDYVRLWKERGKSIGTGIINYCLAHILPTRLRYHNSLKHITPYLYVPTPRSILKAENIKNVDLLWLNGNQDWLLRKAIPHTKLIMRVIDNYQGFKDGYDNFHPLMKETMMAADGVFACSEHVREIYRGFFNDIKLSPNGVDFQHFNKPIEKEPNELRNVPRPRITYVGAVAEWFDFDLVVNLAHRLPHCNFLIFGQWSRIKPAPGTYPENIHILGPVAYEKVPDMLANSDVGLVSFKDTELVRGVSPIKVYEYLAAGLPVVSLRWNELEREALPIYLASNITEFEQGITKALAMPPIQKNKLIDTVRFRSWDHRLTSILKHLEIELNADGSAANC